MHVFDTYTCASLVVLRGHNGKVRALTPHGAEALLPCMSPTSSLCHQPAPAWFLYPQVRSLWWSPDDATLITAGVDGAVYEWRVQEGRRARDFVQKGWSYTAVVSRGAEMRQCCCRVVADWRFWVNTKRH